jgi:hypothetical protein
MNGAYISPCGRYRYWLDRDCVPAIRQVEASVLGAPLDPLYAAKKITWVMLNPSTADADHNDNTINRVIDFSRRWGFDSLRVVNLFALRATDPKKLLEVDEATRRGPENGEHVARAIKQANHVLFAWGGDKIAKIAAQDLTSNFKKVFGKIPRCLAFNKDGSPVHPLYQPKELTPVKFFT